MYSVCKFTGSWYFTCKSCKRYGKSQIYVQHYPNGNLKKIMVFFALANLELYKLTLKLPCPVLEIAAEARSRQPVWRSGKKERWREITIQGADHQAKWDVFDWERIQRFPEEKTVDTETILQERQEPFKKHFEVTGSQDLSIKTMRAMFSNSLLQHISYFYFLPFRTKCAVLILAFMWNRRVLMHVMSEKAKRKQ